VEIVTAMSLVDPDVGGEPRRVTGVLHKQYVAPLKYTKYTVDGVHVDPRTVQLVAKVFDESKVSRDVHGRFSETPGRGKELAEKLKDVRPKLNKLQMRKIMFNNPEGVKGGRILVPKALKDEQIRQIEELHPGVRVERR
jgi:hypothetical protein